MKHLFVPYEMALQLKEKGFDEDCFAYFNGKEPYRMSDDGTLPISKVLTYRNTFLSFKDKDIVLSNEEDWVNHPNTVRKLWGIKVAAPLYQQVIDWFLEKKNIIIETNHNYEFNERSIITWNILITNKYHSFQLELHGYSAEIEGKKEALNKAIEEALKLI